MVSNFDNRGQVFIRIIFIFLLASLIPCWRLHASTVYRFRAVNLIIDFAVTKLLKVSTINNALPMSR